MDTCNDNGNIWVSKIITRSESRAMYGFLSDKEEIKKKKKRDKKGKTLIKNKKRKNCLTLLTRDDG